MYCEFCGDDDHSIKACGVLAEVRRLHDEQYETIVVDAAAVNAAIERALGWLTRPLTQAERDEVRTVITEG